jgi:hypothetical protein
MKLICFPFFKLIILDKATLFENFKDIFASAEAYDRFATVVYDEVRWFFLLVYETYKLGLQVIERGVTTDRTRSYTFLVVRPCTKSCPLPLV